jgi:hypothetical protein
MSKYTSLTDQTPKLLAIGGHPRSGTSLLHKVCKSHPEIALTSEFRNLADLGRSYYRYIPTIRKDFWHGLVQPPPDRRWWQKSKVVSAVFFYRYLVGLLPYWRNVDAEAVRRVLHRIFPNASVVGDKRPVYCLKLERLTRIDGLYTVIIYRDCRDVTCSVFRMIETTWRNRESNNKYMDTPEKMARNWLIYMDKMERYADDIFIIRYEDFVTDPEPILKRLGSWLGIEPAGFATEDIHARSIARYKKELSIEQIDRVMRIAGPTMERRGYV